MVNWFRKDDYGPIAKELLRRYFAHFSTIKIDEKYKEKSFVIVANMPIWWPAHFILFIGLSIYLGHKLRKKFL